MPRTLRQAVAIVESGDGQDLLRFEPDLYMSLAGELTLAQGDCLTLIRRIHGCSDPTARMIYATSWGRYQFLGMTIYSGARVVLIPIWDFLRPGDDEDGAQDQAFSSWCDQRGFHADDPLPAGPSLNNFARLWNGPGNVPVYASKLVVAAA